MADFEIICLANSRKRQGRCIAGIRTDAQGWIRPVGWTKDGGLTPNNYWLDDDSEPQTLDVIQFACARPHPSPYHPEDWILAPSAWKLIQRPAGMSYVDLLRRNLTVGPALFGDTLDKIPAAQFQDRPAESSLALIAPENLRWQIGERDDKRSVTAQFSLCGAAYALRLTDPFYEHRMERLPVGVYPRRAAGISDSATVWLTVSTSEPFQKTAAREPHCHKLVAAVIALPGAGAAADETAFLPAEIRPKQAAPPLPAPRLQNPTKTPGKAALQTVFARNYERWSDSEDERLIAMAKSGMKAEAIAKLLERSESAVLGRIGKLVLAKYSNLLD